jgi:glycosyltransferase involved in cell wall biosynthesis
MTQLGFPGDAFVVGYIGTLFTYESLELLIEAVSTLSSELPKLRLLFVGEGDAYTNLQNKVRKQRLENLVRFTGWIPHDDIGAYYGLVDLFVLPRRKNRLTDLVTPLKPLEIMARAKPVLASNCGGHSELIQDGVNGYLFDSSDPNALSNRIRELFRCKEKISTLGWAARQWVSEHRTWQTTVKPTLDLYARLSGLSV